MVAACINPPKTFKPGMGRMKNRKNDSLNPRKAHANHDNLQTVLISISPQMLMNLISRRLKENLVYLFKTVNDFLL
jgi:hypothetical protein